MQVELWKKVSKTNRMDFGIHKKVEKQKKKQDEIKENHT